MFGLVSEKRLGAEIALRRMFQEEEKAASDRVLDEHAARIMFGARVATLEDLVTTLRAELLAVQSQDALPGVTLDKCPECGCDEWVRVASLVHAQHDGKVERVSLAGSRIMCAGCQTHYHLTPSGLSKPPERVKGNADTPVGKPSQAVSIGVRLPGGRRTV